MKFTDEQFKDYHKIVKREVRCNESFNKVKARILQYNNTYDLQIGDTINWYCELKACKGRENHWIH